MVVTVNSTSGLSALALHVPVVALARPIYDLEGLTFQHGLDRFWTEAATPDAGLFEAFRRVVIDRTHVNGGYFSAQAVDLAVAGSVAHLESAVPHLLAGRRRVTLWTGPPWRCQAAATKTVPLAVVPGLSQQHLVGL